jgi:hypothetical protein
MNRLLMLTVAIASSAFGQNDEAMIERNERPISLLVASTRHDGSVLKFKVMPEFGIR